VGWHSGEEPVDNLCRVRQVAEAMEGWESSLNDGNEEIHEGFRWGNLLESGCTLNQDGDK